MLSAKPVLGIAGSEHSFVLPGGKAEPTCSWVRQGWWVSSSLMLFVSCPLQ